MKYITKSLKLYNLKYYYLTTKFSPFEIFEVTIKFIRLFSVAFEVAKNKQIIINELSE